MPQLLMPFIDQLKAAAEPSRLRLLASCAVNELTVTELTGILGQSQPRVSRHLKKLCDAGLLLRFRERHFVYYRVPAAGHVRRLVSALLGALDEDDPTLAQDGAALRKVLAERAARAQVVLADANSEPAMRSFEEPSVRDQILASADLTGVGDLLDIGTGTGRILKLFGPYARSAIGIDISADMLLVARSNLHAAGLGSVMVRHGDMYRLPYPDDTFDTVTVDDVLGHAQQPGRAVREAARILKPGGQLLIFEVVRHADGSGEAAAQQLHDWVARAGLRLHSSKRIDGDDMHLIVHVSGHGSDAVAA